MNLRDALSNLPHKCHRLCFLLSSALLSVFDLHLLEDLRLSHCKFLPLISSPHKSFQGRYFFRFFKRFLRKPKGLFPYLLHILSWNRICHYQSIHRQINNNGNRPMHYQGHFYLAINKMIKYYL